MNTRHALIIARWILTAAGASLVALGCSKEVVRPLGTGGGSSSASTSASVTAGASTTASETAGSSSSIATSSSGSGEPAACTTVPKPCADVTIKLCQFAPNCTDPVPPFDTTGVQCVIDAFIADAPAYLHVIYTDTVAGQFMTSHEYVLFGDGSVSDEVQGHNDLQPICEHNPSSLANQAYLTACKASTTDADLLACFRSAVQAASGAGATCTNHLSCQ